MALPRFQDVPYERPYDPEKKKLWDRYGNIDDGNQGELIPPGVQFDDDGFPFGRDQPLTQERFERWVMRNPRHNWCFRTKRHQVLAPRYVVGRPKRRPDGTIDYRDEMRRSVVLRFNPFFVKVTLFGISLYVGWRSDKPMWPAPPYGRWQDYGPGGGALDLGAKRIQIS